MNICSNNCSLIQTASNTKCWRHVFFDTFILPFYDIQHQIVPWKMCTRYCVHSGNISIETKRSLQIFWKILKNFWSLIYLTITEVVGESNSFLIMQEVFPLVEKSVISEIRWSWHNCKQDIIIPRSQGGSHFSSDIVRSYSISLRVAQ